MKSIDSSSSPTRVLDQEQSSMPSSSADFGSLMPLDPSQNTDAPAVFLGGPELEIGLSASTSSSSRIGEAALQSSTSSLQVLDQSVDRDAPPTTDPLAPLPAMSPTKLKRPSKKKKRTSNASILPSLQASPMEPRMNSDLSFPEPCVCTITHHVFDQPVVAPNGISYERDAILQTEKYTPDQLYPNRGLQSIIEEMQDLHGDTLDASIRRVQKSMKQGLNQLLEMSALPTDEFRALPDGFYCPITFDLMHVPVIDPEGNTFERVAIENWIRANNSSPITRKKLSVDDLYPNKAIAGLLQLEKEKPEDEMHPSVLKWKSEPPPIMPEITPMDAATASAVSPFPTTLEELEYRRSSRRKLVVCTIFGIVCLILALVAAVLYGGSCIFVSIWVGCCVRDSCRRLREMSQEEEEFTRIYMQNQQEQQRIEREEEERREQQRQLHVENEERQQIHMEEGRSLDS